MRLLNEVFTADYSVDVVSNTPDAGSRTLQFRAMGDSAGAPRVSLIVTPSGLAEPWRGEFFGNRDGADLASRTPDPEHLLLVAGGVPYWVPTQAPETFKIPVDEIVVAIHGSARANVVVLECHGFCIGLDAHGGVVWETPQLVSSTFAEVRLTDSVLVVRGFYAPEHRDIEATVDLVTGDVASQG